MPISETAQGIFLNGIVGDPYDGFTSACLAEALAGKGDVTLIVNSPGGVAMEGAAMHAVISRHPGAVSVTVEGAALSAASLAIMSADEIALADGAFLMIHDPMNLTIGNAEAHRATADRLDQLGEEYARLYAQRCGSSREEVRAMMRDEVWMSPEDAVARGFADRVEEAKAAEPVAFDYTMFRQVPDRLARMARERGWIDPGRSKEAGMPDKQTEGELHGSQHAAQQPTAAPSQATMQAQPADAGQGAQAVNGPLPHTEPAQPQMTAEMKATLDEAARRRVVMQVANIEELTPAEVEKVVADAADPAEAKMKAVDMICDKRAREVEYGANQVPNASVAQRTSVSRDEGETRMEGVIGALRNSVFGAPIEGPAQMFQGMSMKQFAIMLAREAGHKAGYNEIELVKAGMSSSGVLMAGGMHSTSDFTYVTGELMNRQLRAAYTDRPGNWQEISSPRTATDFRTLYSSQFGGDLQMKQVNEHGEYEGTQLTDEGESFKVVRYGRLVLVTFEAIVNDDLGAFSRLPQQFARAARQRESAIAWGIITANSAMSDGNNLFSSGHGNLAGSGAAISATTVGAGRTAMWQQRPLGADGDGDEFINAEPNIIAVPPALELKVLQFLRETYPAKDGDVNPYKPTVRPLVSPYLGAAAGGSDTAWYLFDDSLPVLEHAYLQGYETPMVTSEDKANPKGVEIIAESTFGATAVEFRGAYKNAGS